MIARPLRAALLLAATCAGNGLAADLCPRELATDQKATAPGGWTLGTGGLPTALSGLSIYDGPPEHLADLEWDGQKARREDITYTWTLKPNPRGYWAVCHYANTTVTLARALPKGVRRCTLVTDRTVGFDAGRPVAKSTRCEPMGAEPDTAPSPAARMLRGHVTMGERTGSLRPCGGQEAYRLIDQTGGELHRAWSELAGRGQRIFIEATGEISPAAKGEAGPGTAIAVTLRRAENEGPGCQADLSRTELRAGGSEPFWDVTVTRGAIVFNDPAGLRRIGFPHVPAGAGAGATIWVTESGGASPHRLELRVRPQRCRDPMSGAWYALRAEAVLDGRAYSGCAMEGDAAR